MNLNVLGTVLRPHTPGAAIATEQKPLCIAVTEPFVVWARMHGLLTVIDDLVVGGNTIMDVETWALAFRDGIAPAIIAEHSHERAAYYLPPDVFNNDINI